MHVSFAINKRVHHHTILFIVIIYSYVSKISNRKCIEFFEFKMWNLYCWFKSIVNFIVLKFNLQITDSAVLHDVIAIQSILYDIFADFQYFWSKCVCVFNSIDSIMGDSEMDDLWHNFRVQMTAIVNVEWTNCTKLVDTNQRRK